MSYFGTTQLREILADLPYLVTVAETGGVTAAADELGVPQPTVSRCLARLADRIGAPILTRRGRGVELSPEAVDFLPHAQRALDAVRAGMDAVIRRAEERSNTVSVAFQDTLGRVVVPALLRAVLSVRPGTQFELRQGSHEFCVDVLESGQADAVLLSPPYAGELSAKTIRLYVEPLVLAVPPGHPFAGRSHVRLRELAGQRMLQMRPEFGLRGMVDHILVAAGVELERAFEGEDLHTLRGLVAVGLGVAILPPAVPSSSDVIEVPIADPGAIREIGITWLSQASRSAAARALFEIAAESSDWLPRH
ncbi:LysR family transcriptional regulator [Rathayibacter soli]|uniref:LysR family transcriptional regulator n=1 Tax=Rathayibacter soli TaxID=3144168 RepID=UPI0027E48DD1|nr:LysR family transcriptional regulator [Glaciibacter superstes]